ncbi:hypothetical protein KIH39_21960 [Telmatocola sphagniphila]|uniref:Anaphase-promoting complex subunit 4-like WD40 domain-containing protein n=1 Tax=Telmatocola sphagniphila TaxID=1123043 RepID=A0A8E6B3W5_9BACT|nr:hypothetical protein [Telmatocola sphagniphila]QVL31483.1 hypothetical protein KIH39_21960 [Telmatocola sphagniphila]
MIAYECGQGPVRALAFSPDGKLLASSAGDGALQIWEGGGLKWEQMLSQRCHALGFNAAGTILALGCEDGITRFWDAETGKLLETYKSLQYPVTGLAFVDSDKKILLTAGDPERLYEESKGVTLWNYPSREGKAIVTYSLEVARTFSASPNGQRFAWTTRHNKLITARLSKQDQFHFSLKDPARCLRITNQGTLAAGCSWKISIYSCEEHRFKFSLEGHKGLVSDISFSPDEQFLLSGSWDQTAKLWDLSSGKEVNNFQWKQGQISRVAIAPDGMRYVCGFATGTVLIWDAE